MLRSRASIVDVLVVTVLLGCVALPIATVLAVTQREQANRVQCQRNLLQLGRAIAIYSDENRGKYPRTTYTRDQPPVWGTPYETDKNAAADATSDPFTDGKTRPAPNDVTAALWLIVRTEDIPPETFICPSSRLKPWKFENGASAQSYTNWPGNVGLAAYLSYSYANPYPSTAAISTGYKLDNTLTAEFAVMADMNPGGDAVMKATLDLRVDRNAKPTGNANSPNHDREGQNILFGDGHVEFVDNAFYGTNRDNIYTANGPEIQTRRGAHAAIVASAADAGDSILLPTAADIGQRIEPLDEAAAARADAQGRDQAVQMMHDARGSWSLVLNDRLVLMTVTDTTLTAKSGPVTIDYAYTVVGLRDGAALIECTAPATNPVAVAVGLTPNTLTFSTTFGDFALPETTWTKGDASTTRPALRRPPATSQPSY